MQPSLLVANVRDIRNVVHLVPRAADNPSLMNIALRIISPGTKKGPIKGWNGDRGFLDKLSEKHGSSRFWHGSMLLDEKITARLVLRARDDFLLVSIAVQKQDHLTLGKIWLRNRFENQSFFRDHRRKTWILDFMIQINAPRRKKHALGPSCGRLPFSTRHCCSKSSVT